MCLTNFTSDVLASAELDRPDLKESRSMCLQGACSIRLTLCQKREHRRVSWTATFDAAGCNPAPAVAPPTLRGQSRRSDTLVVVLSRKPNPF